jgi:RNA-directed DNA polymerase
MREKVYPELKKSFEDSLKIFESLQDGNDVANFLEVPLDRLIYILYKSPKSKYEVFTIKKKTSGHRTIEKPIGSIAILQKKLLPFLIFKYKRKKPVHGFVKNYSVLSNAKQHLKKRYILNIDLKDFYGSINFGRIRGLFMSYPFNMGEKAASIIAHICCNDNHIPQGACTSPVLSNLIIARLDRELIHYAQKNHFTYTRYADDITFSSKKEFSKKVIICDYDKNPVVDGFILSDSLKDLIDSQGFSINYDKVRLETKRIRQEVTGITVNSFPNVKRNFIRQIRAMLHSWKEIGLIDAEKKHLVFKRNKIDTSKIKNDGEYLKKVLIGKLAYLRMVRGEHDVILKRLSLKFAELDTGELPKFIKEIKMNSEEFEVFICHASEDKEEIARPLYESLTKESVNAFLDEKYLEWGDSLTEKINLALGRSKYVIAVLSENSINKAWPLKEINSTLAREITGEKKLLTIVKGEHEKIFRELPLLEDKLYKSWNNNSDEIAKEIKQMLSK